MTEHFGTDNHSEDALDYVDTSTDDLARQENMEASRADQDRGSSSHRDALEEGRWHGRSLGDRETGQRH